MQRVAKEQLRHPWLFLGTIIVVVALLLSVATQLQLNSSLDAMIPDDGEFNANERLVSSAFGSSTPYLIIIKPDETTTLTNAVTDMSGPQVAAYAQELEALLSQSQYVTGFGGLRVADEADIAEFIVFVQAPDRIGGESDVKQELEFFMAQTSPPPGVTAQLTGFGLLLNRVSQLLIQDNLTTVVLTTIFIFFFLLWYFKSVRFVIAVMLSPLVALVALAAVMVMLGISITIPLAAVGVLVLGLGVDYSIHIAIHYKHERQAGKSHRQALLAVMDELAIPITASFLTTLAGFAALLFGISPSTQDQGMVLSLAITIIFLVSFFIFPIFLTVLVRDRDIKENRLFGKIKQGLARLAVYQARHPWPILIIFGLITLVMFGGMTQVEFSTSNSNWIPDDDPISVSFREDAYAFGDHNSIIIILESTQGDLRNVQTARDVRILSEALRGIPYVDAVSSPYDNVSYDEAQLFNDLTYTQRRNAFSEDYTVTMIQVASQNPGDDGQGNSPVLAEVRQMVDTYPIHHAQTKLYGDLVRFEELGKSLQGDAAVTTMAGIALVFFIASVMYASIAVGLISLIPILIGLVWAIGLMGYLGVPFTSLSTGIVSLVLGIGIDFSIHLVDGVKRYMKKLSLEDSLQATLVSSGTSILLSSMTTFIGFMALSFSQLLGTRRLGWSLAIAVLAVFIVSMLTVPAIMKLTQKDRHKGEHHRLKEIPE